MYILQKERFVLKIKTDKPPIIVINDYKHRNSPCKRKKNEILINF